MAAMITTPRLMAVGGGALAELPSMLARLGITRPLIVTDPFLVNSGHLERAIHQFERAGICWKVFSDTVSDPTTEVVEFGVSRLAEDDFDSIVAIGMPPSSRPARASVVDGTSGTSAWPIVRSSTGSASNRYLSKYSLLTAPERNTNSPVRWVRS